MTAAIIKEQLTSATVNDVEIMPPDEHVFYDAYYFIALNIGTISAGVDFKTRYNRFSDEDVRTFTTEIIDFEDEDGRCINVDLKECENLVYNLIEEKLEL